MCVDKRLQCRSSYQVNQLWHVKRICPKLSDFDKARLAELIQARANLLGEPIVNQEAYETAMKLLKKEESSA